MDRHVRVTTWNDRWSISSQKTFNLFQARPFTFPWEQLPVKKDGPCSWTISLETFANKPDYRVILSIGKRFNAEKLPHPLPSNVWVRQRVNQNEVLRVVDLFISHGGNNSVHESLFFATPLLVIPIFGDQHANGQVVEDQQLGLQIPSPFRPKLSTDLNHVTKEILMEKVNQLFRHEKAFENNLKLLQQQFLTKNEWIRNHAVQQMNEYVVQWNLKDSHQKSSPVLIH